MRIAAHGHDRSTPTSSLLAAGRKEIETIARTPAISLGVYRCGHKHERRGAEEATPAYTINFPRHGVYVKHVRGREVLAAPGRALFFNRGEPFSTSHPHGCGDGGRWLGVRRDVLLDALGEIDAPALERVELPYRATDVALDAQSELAQAMLFATARERDVLQLEELALSLVARLVRSATAQHVERSLRPVHRELCAAAQYRVVERWREAMTLEELARDLGVSMFHLSRVFKAGTGETLHAYRERVRLRAALDPIAAGATELTEVALEHGYSSHSHFTCVFRRRFGLTPSAFRAIASGARVAELRARLERSV